MNFIPLINGQEFSWSSITLTLFGQPVAGITNISYGYGQRKENIFGSGSNVVARTYNNRTPSASITLQTKEYFAIVNAAPNRDITLIPMFDIHVTYINKAGATVNDTLKNCEFTENAFTTNQNDDMITIELPLVISHVNYSNV